MAKHCFSTHRAAAVVVATSFLAVPPPGDAQEIASKPAQPVTTERLLDDLYLISGEGGNVAALVTDAGVLLVDDMFERNHDGIVAAVASVTAQPIRFVVNTHQHDDHAGGDRLFLPIAEVIAHENVRANLSDIRQPYYEDTPGLPIGLPEVTFTESLTLHLGGYEVYAVHLGRGHTNGDAVIWFPQLGVIHTGDLFIGRGSLNIYADYAQGGSLLEWADTIDAVLSLDFDTIVPGHGPIAQREDLARFRENLSRMVRRVDSFIEMGATRSQVAALLEADYGWRAEGCPPSPPTPGCLQFQQLDALIEELSR